MATRFPGALDRDPDELPDNIADSDNLNSPNHATIHNNVNGAVLQIEEKLGTGDTTPSSGAVLIGTGTGTSAWDTSPTFVGDVTIPEGDLILGSTAVTSTAAEINLLDGSTAGTVVASKAVVVDANKDIASFRNVTLTGELDAATLDISGDVDIDGAADIAGDLVLSGGADGALQFTNAGENSIKIPDNQASALIIEEADNAYITFTTTDSSEAITVAKPITMSSTLTVTGNADLNGDLDVDGTTNLDVVDVDGQLTISDGSAGAPAIAFGSDTNTGFFTSAADEISVSIGGTETFVFDTGYLLFKGTADGAIRSTTSAGREILEFRSGGTSLTSGAGYNMYGDGDSSHPSKHIFFCDSSSSELLIQSTGVTISGSLSKGSGSFNIPHPTKGGDWRLRHSFIEGPTADNIYRGSATISGSSVSIDLDAVSGMTDGTWVALNTNPWALVASSGNAVTWQLSGKTLTITGPDGAVCSWMVIGERKDPTMIASDISDNNGKLIVEYEDANYTVTIEESED